MQGKVFGCMRGGRIMPHISKTPNCFWVLGFPLSSSLFLSKKPKPTTSPSSLFFFLSLRSFLSFLRSSLNRSPFLSTGIVRSRRFSRHFVEFLRFQEFVNW